MLRRVSPRWLRLVRQHLPSQAWPLVLLRVLVVLASVVWLVLTPPGVDRPELVAAVLAAFAAYSIVLLVVVWQRVDAVLRWNLPVLALDLAFALAVIHLTGGARSAFFLAVYLITALQAYYYGTRRGVGVAGAATGLYLAVVWPTLERAAWADYALREGMLILTAVGLGAIGRLERAEREAISALNAELRARDRFVREVVASLRDGVITLDRDRRVTGWNRAMEARYGVSAPEVLGRPLAEVFPSLVREGVAEALDRVYDGTRQGFALERVEHDSLRAGRVVLNFKGTAIRGADGGLRGVILFVEDVTERVALEQSLRQSEKLAGLGTLAAGLAHEINNPIGVIASRAELMLEDAERLALPAQAQDDLQVIRAHAQRVGRITQSLLSFARHRPSQKIPVDLNQVVEDTLLFVGKQLVQDGVRLRVELGDGLGPVHGDPTLLGQVILNLVNNAREAVAHGGEITVRTEVDGAAPGRVRLLVRDTGVGISEEQLGRLFEPFFTTKPSGTGLGLAVCYGIIREHDGLIGVESRPGEGATFVVSLPSLPAVASRHQAGDGKVRA